ERKTESSSAKELRFFREKDKRMKCIYEDEGLEFGDDTSDEATLVSRFEVATKLCKARISEVFRNIRRARNVQLCFLVDVTGSMQSFINGVRDSIDEILKKVTDDGGAQMMVVAFVAYRDHEDTNQFEVLPFTGVSEFKEFSRRLSASGGDDGPEDVFGGLDAALNLDWSDNCGTKVVFHICDAPCHGTEFHSGMRDNYLSGDPKGRTCKGLFSKLREMGIQYHFGKITSLTDIMIKKFSEAYGEPITDFDLKNVDKITDSVSTAVRSAIEASVSASKKAGGKVRKVRDFTLDSVEPNWAALPEIKGKCMSYEFPKSIEAIKLDVPLERSKAKDATMKVAKNPFAKGAERIAFYGKDLSTYWVKVGPKAGEHKKHEDIVLKENLHLGKDINSAKRYELSNQMQTIAAFLAQKFMDDLKKKRAGEYPKIKFLKIKTLLLADGFSKRFMSFERRFSADTKFVRFTNNAGYHIMEEKALGLGVSMEFVQLIFAFSHYTYKASGRFLMVVDLEGAVRIGSADRAGILLTDPAIHCQDRTRYRPMNFGPDGMKEFFLNHKCNDFCKDLGLEGFVC
ncbi:hypothetical protein PENTCL1PPCAC_21180, partial [Pristionchus entomophagus]